MTGVPSIPGIERSLLAYTTMIFLGLNCALAFSCIKFIISLVQNIHQIKVIRITNQVVV
ncbi:hypothetical protein RchiOBHm_Chr4g0424181 [Rosa chinensis]|uniref:Uncharacterized protein n=1 Tax=Rosa chinensis TaxID=74649 RepID=A0A2P6QYT2_ROSCH|nr:hypothetical protein RchiOBHm_Chr4g0424181 [Rosa chinensis]